MTVRIAPCQFCKHLDSDGSCAAFQGPPPSDIASGKTLHLTSRGGEATFSPTDVEAVEAFVQAGVWPHSALATIR